MFPLSWMQKNGALLIYKGRISIQFKDPHYYVCYIISKQSSCIASWAIWNDISELWINHYSNMNDGMLLLTHTLSSTAAEFQIWPANQPILYLQLLLNFKSGQLTKCVVLHIMFYCLLPCFSGLQFLKFKTYRSCHAYEINIFATETTNAGSTWIILAPNEATTTVQRNSKPMMHLIYYRALSNPRLLINITKMNFGFAMSIWIWIVYSLDILPMPAIYFPYIFLDKSWLTDNNVIYTCLSVCWIIDGLLWVNNVRYTWMIHCRVWILHLPMPLNPNPISF